MAGTTYLTTDELSARIKYDVRTIRERLKDRRIGISNDVSRKPALYSPCLGQATRRQAQNPPLKQQFKRGFGPDHPSPASH